MTIPPQGPEDMGWDVDVVIPPNDALFTLDLVTSDPPTLALSVDGEDEVINLVLGADGPRGPTGPAGPSEAQSVVLQAPDGSRWRLVVSNTGALSTIPT